MLIPESSSVSIPNFKPLTPIFSAKSTIIGSLFFGNANRIVVILTYIICLTTTIQVSIDDTGAFNWHYTAVSDTKQFLWRQPDHEVVPT